VTPQALYDAGLARASKGAPKILATGELARAVVVRGVKVSAGAKDKILAAGGRVEE
jgi:large subunit ribosomal protein L15